jgi:RNA polymerase sigma-70 factor (ECF subfamily)
MTSIADSELIAQGKQGDQAAISELFDRHYSSSLRLAGRILRSWDQAQDAVQTAYFSAFQHLSRFREDASFKTWLSRIVVNSCLMQLRDRARRAGWVRLENLKGGLGSDGLVSPTPSPEKAAWFLEIASAFTDAASKLPKHLREVYILHSVAGLTVPEVANALGLTLPAAKMRLFRANSGIRLHLQLNWGGAFSPDASTRSILRGANLRRKASRPVCR